MRTTNQVRLPLNLGSGAPGLKRATIWEKAYQKAGFTEENYHDWIREVLDREACKLLNIKFPLTLK